MKKIDPTTDLRQKILDVIKESQHSLTKNQLAKALGLKADERIELKRILKELYQSGEIVRGSRRRLSMEAPSETISIGELIGCEIVKIDDDGDLLAHPLTWPADEEKPFIRLVNLRRSHLDGRSALGLESKVMLRIVKQMQHEWQGEIVRRLERDQKIHLGIFTPNKRGGYLSSCNRKDSFSGAHLTHEQSKDLKTGDVVKFIQSNQNGLKILKRIGSIDDPHIFSELAIHNYGIPHIFSEDAIEIAEKGKIPPLGNRTDYRHVDLVTIDGEDARDFDDAVWAAPDEDPRNPNGWRAIVAIADVSYYVRSGSSLDKEAYERGNSVYFPDRVVPMLPEALSNEMCSLKPSEDRACMVIEMIISENGKIKSHKVKRGLMRSRARLTYNQVQNAIEGKLDSVTESINDSVIKPLYGVYKSLLKARDQRGTLDLDVPERQILFDKNGDVKNIVIRERFDSHKLIEELMIAANVAAAKTLVAKGWPCLFRVHDRPDAVRVENLRQILRQLKIKLEKGSHPEPKQFNQLLHKAKNHKFERLVNELVLRSQSQAKYSPENLGHFGLSLAHYAHFTSPIRRYADLVVHRCLITALELGDDGYKEKPMNLDLIGDHISQTERTAALAEREVSDRFAISFVSENVGQTFKTVIVGVNRVGLFVEIPASGAQGFIPKSSMGYNFTFDEPNYRFVDHRSKQALQLGDMVEATLVEADVVTNSLSFRLNGFENRSGRPSKESKKQQKPKKREDKSLEKDKKRRKRKG